MCSRKENLNLSIFCVWHAAWRAKLSSLAVYRAFKEWNKDATNLWKAVGATEDVNLFDDLMFCLSFNRCSSATWQHRPSLSSQVFRAEGAAHIWRHRLPSTTPPWYNCSWPQNREVHRRQDWIRPERHLQSYEHSSLSVLLYDGHQQHQSPAEGLGYLQGYPGQRAWPCRAFSQYCQRWVFTELERRSNSLVVDVWQRCFNVNDVVDDILHPTSPLTVIADDESRDTTEHYLKGLGVGIGVTIAVCLAVVAMVAAVLVVRRVLDPFTQCCMIRKSCTSDPTSGRWVSHIQVYLSPRRFFLLYQWNLSATFIDIDFKHVMLGMGHTYSLCS